MNAKSFQSPQNINRCFIRWIHLVFIGFLALSGCGRELGLGNSSQHELDSSSRLNSIKLNGNGNGNGNGHGHGNGNGNGHNPKPTPVPPPVASPVPPPVTSPVPPPVASPVASPKPSPSPVPVADTQAPSIPGGLLLRQQGYQTAGLSWNGSSDNVKVTGYHVYRDGNLVQTLNYSNVSVYMVDTGLNAATSYGYAVSAFDVAGNESSRSAILTVVTLSAPIPVSQILATASSLIDAFAQVQYTAEFATNGYGWPTYGGCSAGYCTSAQYLFGGIQTVNIQESGMDAAVVSQGSRETQFAMTKEYSQLYLNLGGTEENYRLTFGNNDHDNPVPNVDSASLSYQTSIDRNTVQELVLVISNIDNSGMNIGVEVSDGSHTATLKLTNLTGFASQKQLSFPLSMMSGINNLSSTITKVKLTLYSGGYGLDSGYSAFFAR